MIHRRTTLVLLIWLLSFALPAVACTLEFRPTEWIVTRSPLIFIGRIEEVQEFPKQHCFTNDVEGSGDTPMLARVKVLRVLHGPPTEGEVRVHSGPLHT